MLGANFLKWSARTATAGSLFLAVLSIQSCKSREYNTASTQNANAFRGVGEFPIWEYDAGPNPRDSIGKKLIDLHAAIPYFPGLSNAIYGDQMFRPAFGPIPWRMQQAPNSVKILFIGQDGTHIAEAAGRPATAGFGGRAQDLAKYFGVSSGAAFINTYAFTIRWQYGAFDSPVISTGRDGKKRIQFKSYTGTPVWLLSQDINSPITRWRNDVIEWIIRNNKDSLKLIVLFGGAARDAAGAFIESKGGKVGSRLSVQEIVEQQTMIPEFDLKNAGGNKQTATPFSRSGGDLLLEFAKENQIPFSERDYKDPEKVESLQKKFVAAFNAEPDTWLARMVLPPPRVGTPNASDPLDAMNGTGMVHPAQLGGYDIAKKIQIGNGELGTLSLKGLKLGSDFTISNHIVVTQFPHPTALSMMKPQEASEAVNKALEAVRRKYPPSEWNIEAETSAVDPDSGQALVNRYAAGLPYKYGRADMGTEYYDFGAPNSRMVNVSSASRDGANVIVFGTRDRVSFDKALIRKMTYDFKPSAWETGGAHQHPFDDEMWISRATHTDGTINHSNNNRRYTFDAGPTKEMAELMKKNLPRNPKFTALERDGSSINGDFGHYRGTFKDPMVVIIADPDGEDDLITARALTGSRGQFLHGLMEDMGVGDKYLVLKTAPYSNYSDGDPNSEGSRNWVLAMEATQTYRDAVLKKIFTDSSPQLIITDGKWAAQEFSRIFPVAPSGAKVVNIQRNGVANNFGILEAGKQIAEALAVPASAQGKMKDIPRSHLTYYARVWEGTSGDRVITSTDLKYRGKAFAEVAPAWAYKQTFRMSESDFKGCKSLVEKALKFRVRLGQAGRHSESIETYQERTAGRAGAPSPDTICRQSGGDEVEADAGNFDVIASEDFFYDPT